MLDVNANINIPAVNEFADKVAALVPEVKKTVGDIDDFIKKDAKETLATLRKILPFLAIPFCISAILSVATFVCVVVMMMR